MWLALGYAQRNVIPETKENKVSADKRTGTGSFDDFLNAYAHVKGG